MTYRFEYSEDGGISWTALPDRENTSKARSQILVAEDLGALRPATAYQYRFSAENSAGPASPQGEEKTFGTRTSEEVTAVSPCPNEDVRKAQHTEAYLGECRGIELVNSPDKGNQHVRAEVLLGTSPLRADGNEAIWNVLAGAPGGNSGASATFLAQRTTTGWISRSLVPPGEDQVGKAEAGGYFPHAITPDFSSFVFNAGKTGLSEGKTLVRLDANQHQTVLKEYASELFGGAVDLSDDGSRVFYVDKDPPHQLQLLEGGAPETISVMPDGIPNECGLDSGMSNSSFVGGGGFGVAAAKQWRPGYHMISAADASRVYFQAKPNEALCKLGLYGIYERDRESSETTLIDPGGKGISPQFIRATPDGRTAYFLTYSKLDSADTNSDPDVYRWSEAAGKSDCLTCVVPDADVRFKDTGVGGKVMISDDFSHVYFESTKQLVPGEGRAGEINLYALAGGEVRFVADPDYEGESLGEEAVLSADGNVLLIKVPASSAVSADAVAAGKSELYRYDDRDGSIECISCRFGGVTESSVGSPEAAARHDFKMSADGSTIAFVTVETLVPQDINRFADVYEWRNGVRGLLSNGVDIFPTGLVAAPQVHGVSADGSDILFSVVDPGLTGFEQDGFANLYDARIDGGFEPPGREVHCSEDSCQGPLVPAPTAIAPASAVFDGHGNLKPPSRKIHCVRRGRKAGRKCPRRHGRAPRNTSAHPKAGQGK